MQVAGSTYSPLFKILNKMTLLKAAFTPLLHSPLQNDMHVNWLEEFL